MRIIDLATALAIAAGTCAGALACQPQTLDRSALSGTVSGTVSGSDAQDTAGDSDAGGDSASDSTATDTAPADQQADSAPDQSVDAAETSVDSGVDAEPVDVLPACKKDTDCPVKPCQKGSCTTNGCTYTPAADKSGCDDGDECTLGEHCEAGACIAGTVKICECVSDLDCLELSNICTGPMKCDLKTHKCSDVGMGVACPDASPKDCVESYCDPTATTIVKACKTKPLADKTLCDDGISCTINDYCMGGKCIFEAKACACLTTKDCEAVTVKPDDLCTGVYYCAPDYTCKKTAPVVCEPSDNPCLTNVCDPKTGSCKPTPVQKYPTACDDNNDCTKSDVCEVTAEGVFTGKCSSGTNTCKCVTNADCAAWEDGDKCNGTLYCDPFKGECVVNDKTKVNCPQNFDNACAKRICDKKTGVCQDWPIELLTQICPVGKPDCGVYVPLAAGISPTQVPCEDGNVCTASSVCQKGQCAAESTSYVCSCTTDADCAAKDDGNLCNGTLICNKNNGSCEINPATVVVCPTVGDTQCAKNLCNPKTGLCEQKALANGPTTVLCEDGNSCTVSDYCLPDGSCKSGPNTCICTSDKDCSKVDDGNLCNGTLFCNLAVTPHACEINPATVKYCTPQFNNQCRKNTCQPETGECAMVISGNGILCDDGNACTESDVCKDGECTAGPNTCVCNNQTDCAKLEDGNLCNGSLYCDLAVTPHKCKVNPATIISCPTGSDTACLLNRCDPATGLCNMLPPQELYAVCTDDNPCTIGDVCIGSKCVSGANICGCSQKTDCAAFDDGNPCNGEMSCVEKTCAVPPTSVKTCEAGDTCVKNVCEAGANMTTTCKSVPIAGACDDKNPCTTDACSNGTCSHQAINDSTTPCSIGSLAKVCVQGVCVLKP